MDRHFLNLHVLISHSSSCLNRDDMNMQKSAYFGGVRRIRVSSQCQKRAIRMSERYKELFGAPSTRTRQDTDLFDHFRNQERFKTYSDALLEYIIRESKMDNKVVTPWIDDEMEKLAKISTEYLREEAISHEDFMALIEKAEKEAIDATEASDKKKKSKTKKEPKNNSLEGLTKALEKGSKEYLAAGISCIDIALSGRMCASGVLQNVEGALSMAHSITTHAMEAEIDWFTAMDDLKEEAAEEAGAGHLNTQEFGSGVFYRYASIDMRLLTENLGGDSARARETAKGFAELFATVVPTGKQRSFASYSLADLVFAVRSPMPIALHNAFEKPVRATKTGGLMQPSISALAEYWEKTHLGYGLDEESALFSLHDSALEERMTPFSKLLDWIGR